MPRKTEVTASKGKSVAVEVAKDARGTAREGKRIRDMERGGDAGGEGQRGGGEMGRVNEEGGPRLAGASGLPKVLEACSRAPATLACRSSSPAPRARPPR